MERKHGRIRGQIRFGTSDVGINFQLSLIVFEEDGIPICYCPALDLSAAGTDEANAVDELKTILVEYFEHVIAKGTLSVDLRKHGWKVPESKRKKMVPPDMEYMVRTNQEFKRVVDTVPYKSISTPVNIPVFA